MRFNHPFIHSLKSQAHQATFQALEKEQRTEGSDGYQLGGNTLMQKASFLKSKILNVILYITSDRILKVDLKTTEIVEVKFIKTF